MGSSELAVIAHNNRTSYLGQGITLNVAATIVLNKDALLREQEWERATTHVPLENDTEELARTKALHQEKLKRIPPSAWSHKQN